MVLAGGPLATTADQFTDNIGADQQKLAQNAQSLQQLSSAIASAQLQEPQIQADIDKLNQQIAQTEALVNQNQTILDGISANLAATQAKLAEEKAKLVQEKDHLASQLVIVYELQQQSTPINNLLTSHNFNDFWQSLIETRRISGETNQVTVQVQQMETQVQADIDQIKVQQAQQQSVVAELVATKYQLAQEQATQQRALAALQAAQAADQAKVAQLTASNNNLNNEIAQLNAQEAAAQAAANSSSSGGGGGGGGSFVWPDSGPISQGFGCTTFQFEAYDASCPYPHRFHNGIDIAGACGNAILAAAAGVVHIEPYDRYGFGNYIIIQHGGGWSTLYGHMSGFDVGNGASVGQGQRIGWEGSTGNSTGCHLHFGINTNNQWVNPLQYLP